MSRWLKPVAITLVILGAGALLIWLITTTIQDFRQAKQEGITRTAIATQNIRDAGWEPGKIMVYTGSGGGAMKGEVVFGACTIPVKATAEKPRDIILSLRVPQGKYYETVEYPLKAIKLEMLRAQRTNFGLGHCFIDPLR